MAILVRDRLDSTHCNDIPMRLISLILVAVFLLAACGKKGELYLPTQTQPVATQSSSNK
jgi:uncharacterized lipoprotein YajG